MAGATVITCKWHGLFVLILRDVSLRYLHGLEPMNIDMEKEFRILSGQNMMSKNLLSIDKLVGPNDLVLEASSPRNKVIIFLLTEGGY